MNAFPESRRAEAEAFIALAERLARPEAWLPAGAWLDGPVEVDAWVPDRYLLKVTDWGYVPDVPSPVDVADLVWPLDAGPLEIGDAVDLPDFGAADARCAVLDLAEARWVEAALSPAFGELPAERRIPAEYLAADLAWAERGSFVSISLRALLPDDPSDCSIDPSWP